MNRTCIFYSVCLLTALLSGCAIVGGGRYEMSEGWRFGWVRAIGSDREMPDVTIKQCLGSASSRERRFVTVAFWRARSVRTIAVELAPDAQLKNGDTVYVNVRTCAIGLQPR